MGAGKAITNAAGVLLMDLIEVVSLFLLVAIFLVPAILVALFAIALRITERVWEFGERRSDDVCLKMIKRLAREERLRVERERTMAEQGKGGVIGGQNNV